MNTKNWRDFKRRTHYWRVAREATSTDIANLTPLGKLYCSYVQAHAEPVDARRSIIIDSAIDQYLLDTKE